MVSASRELERIKNSLDEALSEADEESAKYHIREAAQRVEIFRYHVEEGDLTVEE
ncbi:hypothetical protein [Halorientalis pallida]|uniref:hypothetical protein n=1 Tax=Halorientalis pallida TaxID=2479928 RepID=UPI00187D3B7A|nr:hypothetical protein [Halorientalis pallida]